MTHEQIIEQLKANHARAVEEIEDLDKLLERIAWLAKHGEKLILECNAMKDRFVEMAKRENKLVEAVRAMQLDDLGEWWKEGGESPY